MKRLVALACLVPGLAACSGSVEAEFGADTLGGRPACTTDVDRGLGPVSPGLVLMAQSVPTASMLPCLGLLPEGWTFESLQANEVGATFWLDSAHDGRRVVSVDVSRDCDVADATSVRSEHTGTQRYERVDRLRQSGQLHYVFDGGCVTYDFDAPGALGPEPLAAVFDALKFVQRAEIADIIHDSSDGRLSLDPSD